MKKLILAAVVMLLSAGTVRAARTGDLGVGFNVGSPMGITAKWWYGDLLSFDGGVGYGNAGVFYADFNLNNWTLFNLPWDGRTNLYVSAGPRIATDDGGQFAIRTLLGSGFWPKDSPFEFFAEFGPTFKVTPDSKVGVDGGLGLRYYFTVTVQKLKKP